MVSAIRERKNRLKETIKLTFVLSSFCSKIFEL
jgi:hypothetical protein